MWTAIFIKLVTDHSSLVVHSYLLAGEALAAICVMYGIIWESNEYGASVHRVARNFVIWGVIAETVFSLLLFVFDEGISSAQREKIIVLETRLAARTLSDPQIAGIEKRLGPFAGQTFQIIPYWDDDECLAIANRIADALTASNWKIEQPERYTALIGVVTGIKVYVDDGAPEDTIRAAKELAAALNESDIAAAVKSGPSKPPTSKIGISVGIKP